MRCLKFQWKNINEDIVEIKEDIQGRYCSIVCVYT